jgi:phosphatidylinositol alpha-1,6-mannosyltransferase
MKKVLIISLEFPPQIGGIATYVQDLAKNLDPQNVLVLAPPMKDSKEWDEAQPYTIIRHDFFYPKFIWPRWLKLLKLVKRIVQSEGIELIMVHHILPVGTVALQIFKSLKVPYIVFSHGTDMVMASTHKRKKKLAESIGKNSLQVITNSENLKMRLLERFPDLVSKTSVMYPCPDPDFLVPPPAEEIEMLKHIYALEGKHVILTVSRFAEGKGFPHLLRVMPEILKRVPHLVWMIVGDGEAAKRNEILGEIQSRNLQNIVRFVGMVPHHELKKFYYLADLFVLLTHPDNGLEEGLGLVFLEAAAAGKPTVAGRSGGVEEAVLSGQTGLVLNVVEEPQTIVDSIVNLIEKKEASKELGQNGQNRIKSEFNWESQLAVLRPWIE